MSNPLIKKLIDQINDKYPDLPKDVIRDIWLAGYSRGIKGKIRNVQKPSTGITSDQANVVLNHFTN